MAFNINNFRSELKGDGARPNLFEFTMSTVGLDVGEGDIAVDLSFKCRVAQIPESNMGMIPVTYFGREIKVPGNRTFPELTITVLNDEDFKIRKVMESWMNLLNSHVGNIRSPDAMENSLYGKDAFVTQYGKKGDSLRTYKFVGCWPTNVSAIDLDWGANDQIEEYQITLAFQWWEDAEGITTDSP